jgi:glycosyltransferase involved in cell wall biosynthesis
MVVLAPGAPGAPTEELRDGVEVHRARYWFDQGQALASGLGGIVPNLRTRPWLAVQVVPLVASLTWHAIRRARTVDVVHAHWVFPSGIAGVAASRWRKKPLVLTSHGGDLNLAARARPLEALAARVSRAADACIGVSDAMVQRFLGFGVAPASVHCIPYGIRITSLAETLRPDTVAFSRFVEFDGLKVVYVGSLIRRKSVRTLIEAARGLVGSVARVRIAVVGEGPELDDLRAAAATAPAPDVVFAGQCPPESARAWMAAADILVLPSLSEGRPLVVLEAMSHGAVVVASNIDGTRDLVRHEETGLLFPAEDVVALRQHLLRLATYSSELARLRSAAFQEVERQGLSAGEIARRHQALYAELTL